MGCNIELLRFEKWSAEIPASQRIAFAPITTAWRSWHEPIQAYFDHPVTNAYTESLNNLIRVMNRLGRGYSFEALRAKILFTEGLHKHVSRRPKFERRAKGVSAFAMMTTTHRYGTPDQEPDRNLGVDIDRLTEQIKAGRL